MRKIKVPTLGAEFARGLNTTAQEDGLPYPFLTVAQDLRYSRTGVRRRPGMRRIGRAANENGAYDLNGSSQYATILLDTRIHTFKRRWTLEALVKADSFATNAKTIFGAAHASNYSCLLYFNTSGNLVAKVQDSAATVVTLTSATAFSTGTTYATQIVRDGTTVTMKVDGTTEDSDTVADLDGLAPGGNLYIGRDNGGLYFDGVIDFLRLFSTARSSQDFGKTRLILPRSEDVLFDYVMEAALTGGATYAEDRSRFENHAAISGSPSETTALCVQTAPVTGFFAWPDENAKHRTAMFAGRELYLQNMER